MALARKSLYRTDFCALVKNVRKEVNELSKAEVESRRTRSSKAADLLKKINDDIEMIEQQMLFIELSER